MLLSILAIAGLTACNRHQVSAPPPDPIAKPRAHLVITNLDVSPSLLMMYQDVVVKVRVANRGAAQSAPYAVTLTAVSKSAAGAGTYNIGSVSGRSLLFSESEELVIRAGGNKIGWKPGTYDLTATLVKPPSAVASADRFGESAWKHNVIVKPRGRGVLYLAGVEVSPSSITADQEIVVKARVQNRGAEPSGEYGVNVGALLAGHAGALLEPLLHGESDTLAPGQSKEFSQRGRLCSGWRRATYEVTAALYKPDRAVSDEDHLDNQARGRSFLVIR